MHTYIYIYMFLCWCVGLSIFHMSLSLNLGFTQYILPRYLKFACSMRLYLLTNRTDAHKTSRRANV